MRFGFRFRLRFRFRQKCIILPMYGSRASILCAAMMLVRCRASAFDLTKQLPGLLLVLILGPGPDLGPGARIKAPDNWR